MAIGLLSVLSCKWIRLIVHIGFIIVSSLSGERASLCSGTPTAVSSAAFACPDTKLSLSSSSRSHTSQPTQQFASLIGWHTAQLIPCQAFRYSYRDTVPRYFERAANTMHSLLHPQYGSQPYSSPSRVPLITRRLKMSSELCPNTMVDVYAILVPIDLHTYER